MKISNTKIKVYSTLFLLLCVICGSTLYTISRGDSNAATNPLLFAFQQGQQFSLFSDARIPNDKAYSVFIYTYDRPDYLMDNSYIEIKSFDGTVLKSQYFNGNPR